MTSVKETSLLHRDFSSLLRRGNFQVAFFVGITRVRLGQGEGEGEVAVFSDKCLDRRSSEALIESATPCHDAQVVRPYRVSN